jgi:uncharacterized protein YdeI (YjbR/CyaY-like superfamily)
VALPNDVIFFASAVQFRRWLRRNHASTKVLWAGYYRKHTGHPSMTWQESVDEALCVGWIDGIRKRIDEDRYTIRFTPRRKGSIWSATNIRRVQALTNEKRMQPAGLKSFDLRIENKSAIYSYEQRRENLPRTYATEMRRNPAAWKHFSAQPPSYRKMVVWWVVSAKQEETRRKRLVKLIAASTRGVRL